MRRELAALCFAALIAQHVAAPRPLSACAPAPLPGDTVAVADEEALVVHDPVAGLEHFIRRAAFRTAAREFGFIVPTPAPPALAEAPAWVFERLAARVAPRVETRTRTRGVTVASCCLAPLMLTARSAGDAPRASAVEVLATQRVAGYDAAVLRADDPAALGGWLASHGYADSADLRAWSAPYVSARWVFTAFRVAKADPNDPRPPGTANVRMTFATPRAVYPYREPASQRADAGAPRRLRVHVLSAARVEGRVGVEGPAFPGRVTWAGAASDWARLLESAVPAAALQGRLWLTSFDDTSSPRPGTDDVWFSPAAQQTAVTPPPVVRWRENDVPIPVDLIALVAVGAWWWRRRGARRSKPPEAL